MKHLVTLITLVTLLGSFYSCRRHSSTVTPFGWPSVSPVFDSLTVEAENLYFIVSDPDSLLAVINRMQAVTDGYKGKQAAYAQACVDYWKIFSYIQTGQAELAKSSMSRLDSILAASGSDGKYDYISHRLLDFQKAYMGPKEIETFRVLLKDFDYYRSIGDYPQAGNIAVLLSNSLQYAQAQSLALHYLNLADSLYVLSGQDERRKNVRFNEPIVLCMTGQLDEGRVKMDAILRDSVAMADPLTKEVTLRNHYYFFNDSSSLLEGHRLVEQLSEDPGVAVYMEQTRALYDALMCKHYMNAGRLDSAGIYYARSREYKGEADLNFQCTIYRIWAAYLESKGRINEANEVLNRFVAVNDSLYVTDDPEKKEYLERVNALSQHEADAEREKRAIERKHNMIAAILIFLLLLAVITVQWLRHRNKVRTMRLQMEAEKMERQILAMSLSKEETDKVLDKVKEETARLKEEGSVSARDLSQIETNIRMHMAAKEEMQAFEKAFAEVSPGFAERLKELSPSISQNNIRLCTYLYMGLSGQQICGILNVTPGALRQAKRRLRQRFGLAGDDSIEDFLRSLTD